MEIFKGDRRLKDYEPRITRVDEAGNLVHAGRPKCHRGPEKGKIFPMIESEKVGGGTFKWRQMRPGTLRRDGKDYFLRESMRRQKIREAEAVAHELDDFARSVELGMYGRGLRTAINISRNLGLKR